MLLESIVMYIMILLEGLTILLMIPFRNVIMKFSVYI